MTRDTPVGHKLIRASFNSVQVCFFYSKYLDFHFFTRFARWVISKLKPTGSSLYRHLIEDYFEDKIYTFYEKNLFSAKLNSTRVSFFKKKSYVRELFVNVRYGTNHFFFKAFTRLT